MKYKINKQVITICKLGWLLFVATLLVQSNNLLAGEVNSHSQFDLQDSIKLESLKPNECNQAIESIHQINNAQVGRLDQEVISEIRKSFLGLITVLDEHRKRGRLDLEAVGKINGVSVTSSLTNILCDDLRIKVTDCLFNPGAREYCSNYPVNYVITFNEIEKLNDESRNVMLYKNNIYINPSNKTQQLTETRPQKVVDLVILDELADRLCITKDEISALLGEPITHSPNTDRTRTMYKLTGACNICTSSFNREGYYLGSAPSQSNKPKSMYVNTSAKHEFFFSQYNSHQEACLSAAYFMFNN